MNNSQIRSYDDNTFRYTTNLYNQEVDWNRDVAKIRNLAYSISSTAFDNVNEFPYLYFTAGVTDALNIIIPKNPVTVIENEYRYLKLFNNVTTNETDTRFMSYPFSGNGKFLTIPEDKPLILDCSYIFASDMNNQKIIPSNVKQVLFGLSKSHNLPDYRIGWILSKERIKEFHLLQYEFKYTINGNVQSVLEKVKSYDSNFLYNKHRSYISTLYKQNGIEETNTNLFGIKNDIKIPWYTLV